MTVLEKAGLVEIEKGYQGRRGRTRVYLTATGEKALDDEIAHLKRIISQVEETRAALPPTIEVAAEGG